MKAGEVVHIRVNPEDVMGCIDILDRAKMYTQGMSMAQVVRLALSGLLQAARDQGVIPVRDGFEYEHMASRYTNAHKGRKILITNAVEAIEMSNLVLDKPATPVRISLARDDSEAAPTPFEMKKARVAGRMLELSERKRVDPSNFDEQQELELDRFTQAYTKLDSGEDVDTAKLFGGLD